MPFYTVLEMYFTYIIPFQTAKADNIDVVLRCFIVTKKGKTKMETAQKIREMMAENERKVDEKRTQKAIEYCDTIIMEKIRNRAEVGNHDVPIELPADISAEKCLNYLVKNGYTYRHEKSGGGYPISFTIEW